jgi:hypothetical protein
MNPNQYANGLPSFAGGSGTLYPGNSALPSLQVVSPSSTTLTGPKFSVLMLAIAGMGVVTFLLPRGLGEWIPVLFLGGYMAAQSTFVTGLLQKFNTSIGVKTTS